MAQPVLPGLALAHGLDDRAQGELLMSELRCAACHDAGAERSTKMSPAPDLSWVGARLRGPAIIDLLARPEVHAASRMPDMLHELAGKARTNAANALTHFLLQQSKPIRSEALPGNARRGKELFHQVGCVACHGPEEGGASTDLAIAVERYLEAGLADFLLRPLTHRPAGRMPDMKLSRQEAADIARFLIGEPRLETALELDASLADVGKVLFESQSCSACHQSQGIPAPTASSSLGSSMNLEAGCLADGQGASPDFRLSPQQRTQIVAALTTTAPLDPDQRLLSDLTRFQCIACHQRDDHGGVREAIDAYFTSSEPGLGNESRIPPPLTEAGAKLQPSWMAKVLFDGAAVREYMHTRMPQFGESNLAHLPALFAQVDKPAALEIPEPGQDQRKIWRTAGQQLLGDKGLNCVSCHNFNAHASQGMKGIDLITSSERLQPAWLFDFLKDPQSKRPGTLMPSYWPGGEAIRSDILDGDTEAQLQALWYTFTLGRSAGLPSGMRGTSHQLLVDQTTRVYRGRSRVAGYRGIAVGFPGGLSYAFNAEYGTLSALWQGEFVSVGWNSQGAGDFNPRSRAIQLAQDVSFCRLADLDAPWPLKPVMTKEQPVNPDPLYPRNHGYAFKGYDLDETGIPTFRYQSGDIAIEDRSEPLRVGDTTRLHRRLQFTAAQPETLYFRALHGAIKSTGADAVWNVGKILLRTPADAVARLRGEGDTQELIFILTLPAGQSTLELDYEQIP